MVEWFRHFFWLIGWSVWCLIQFDFDNFIDTIFWLRIHLTCRASCIGRTKLGIKQEVINFIIVLVGFITFCLIIFLLFNSLNIIKTYVKSNR